MYMYSRGSVVLSHNMHNADFASMAPISLSVLVAS